MQLSKKDRKQLAKIINSIECYHILFKYGATDSEQIEVNRVLRDQLIRDTLSLHHNFGIDFPNLPDYL